MEHNQGTQSPSQYIAGNLRRWRKHRDLTAVQLAELVNQAGVPGVHWGDPEKAGRQVVGKLETGRRQAVTVDELTALAKALGMTVFELLPEEAVQPYTSGYTWYFRPEDLMRASELIETVLRGAGIKEARS
jgi:transcriptional regulator with XRE-family HTH domain